MPSPNGSEHVLSSCGAQYDAKEHQELGHCIDEPIVHDDKSLDRRNGRMRFSDFHGILHEYMRVSYGCCPYQCSASLEDAA
ncbi:hypothetical protein RHMOL_Rhmol10G0105600 [Rhododendron molle]|uniref:Uncharacterized protein n=1 Tax=Rhododendron molle TaxID=49168 RepID=A0ACC0M141_RHOML|nr:hypothetical protein RHMOL_Rhmol10G0105600 [Rhododendron molle]